MCGAGVAKAQESRKNSITTMAQAATNPKIEELRSRLKSDPKSRIFFPLAEELRKLAQAAEAEQVLRTGLTSHPTYLSAWVSLGRVLHELHKDREAVDALNKALQLDPGNVVAARLLAEAYLALGEKVEAIKKYKLVYALLPGDQELEGIIERLDREINAPAVIPEPEGAAEESPFETAAAEPAVAPVAEPEAPSFQPPTFEAAPFDAPSAPLPPADGGVWDDTDEARIFHDATASLHREQTTEVETGDIEPMSAAHAESPFEEPAASEGYSSDAFEIERPEGMHVTAAPTSAEVAEPLPVELPADVEATAPGQEAAEEADVFEPADSGLAPGIVTEPFAAMSTLPPMDPVDFARTLTMADLYFEQGLIDEARDIYEDILARDPGNAIVRAKLEAASARPGAAPPAEQEGPWEEEPAQPPTPPAALPDLQSESPASVAAPTAQPAETSGAESKADKLNDWLAKMKRGEGRV